MVVDVEDLDRVFLGQLVLVHADDDILAGVDARLFVGGAGFDLHLGPAGFDGLGHAAHRLDFLDDAPGLVGHVLGQLFHHVGTGPRIDDVGDVGFFLDDQLRVAGDAGRELGRQGNGFVERIGVQRLGAAEDRRHRLDGGADDVVVRVLLGQRPAGSLAVRAQHHRLGVLGAETGHDAVPQQAGGAHLGDFEIEIHAHRPEKGQAASEGIDVHARLHAGTHVFHAVSQGEGQLDGLVGTRFLDVIAGNGNRVELRHVLRRVGEDVGDDLHRRRRRIDVGVADHELLEDVVLDGARQLVLRHALFLGGDDVAGENGQHGAVHGHGDGNLVERNAVEQDLHVFHGIDGHACLADVAGDARMVGVIAAVGGQVEGDRHALATGGKRLAVEGVGGFGGGEAGILADGPRLDCVHGRLRAAQERGDAREGVGEFEALDIFFGVQRLDLQTFRRMPHQIGDIATRSLLGGRFFPCVESVGVQEFFRHERPFAGWI